MSNLSNYAETQWLNYLFGQTAIPNFGTYYVGLLTNGSFVDGNTPTENVGNGYARIAVTNDKTTGFNAAVGDTVTNKNNIAFAAATGAWTDVSFAALFDALTTGNLICWAALQSSPVAVASGTQLTINAGDLSFKLD